MTAHYNLKWFISTIAKERKKKIHNSVIFQYKTGGIYKGFDHERIINFICSNVCSNRECIPR